MSVNAIAPWYGSNRLLASNVGEALDGCDWVGVVFAGGMSELPHVRARTLVVNDVHRQVINLACVTAHATLGPRLYRILRRAVFHPDVLAEAQIWCKRIDSLEWGTFSDEDRLLAAAAYFTAVWMGRSAKAGTKDEFSGQLALRWNASGGDSAVRYQSAVRALVEFRRVLRRATFSTLDFAEFLGKCKDAPGSGIYADAPFDGGPGDSYKHTFGPERHRELRDLLAAYKQTRIVCRYYDTAFIRGLYPESDWNWLRLAGRKQSNAEAPEVLICRLNASGCQPGP